MAGLDMSTLGRKVQRTAAGFSTTQKLIGAVVTVAVIGGVFLIAGLGGNAAMAPLFTNLDPADAQALTEELKTRGVPYEIGAGGTSILVPEDRVYDTRIAVSTVALPSSGKVGYGVLDNQGLTTSEFGQRVGFQRAMEGELAKTIEAIDAVETATVHLAIPQNRVFAMADEQPSGSVLVRTRPGSTLSGDQVRAIRNVVAGGIEGMLPEQVSVTDAEGRVLAAPGEDVTAGGGGADPNQERTRAYEAEVAASIKEMLAPTVGADGVRVKVAAELNYDQRTVSSERFTQPDGATANSGLVQGEKRKNETYTGIQAVPGGPLALDAAAQAAGGETSYELEDSNTQYALDRTVETVNSAPGVVQQLSVAVLVDEGRVAPEQVAAISELVSAGANLRVDRGDSVVVSRMPFDTTAADTAREQLEAAEAAKAAEERQRFMQTMVLIGVLAIVLLIAFVSFRRSMRKRRLRNLQLVEVVEEPEALPASRATAITPSVPALDLAESIEDVGPGQELVRAPLNMPMPVLSDEAQLIREQRQVAVAELIDQQPEEVAQLLRGWLGDRREVTR